MAFALATQTLIDGPRNTVVKVTGDVTAAVAQTTLIQPASFTSMNPGMSGSFSALFMRIDRIEYSITDGAIVQLLWNATTDVPIVELYGRGKVEARWFGGLQNNAGAGNTGNIDIAVIASGAAFPTDASIMLIIHLVKFRPTTLGGA